MSARSPANNPFVPGSDRIPTVWAGRDEELSDWRDRVRPRRLAGEYAGGRLLLGNPGIGKSVLANRIAAEAAEAGDLVAPTVRLPRGADVLALLAESLTTLVDDRKLGGRLTRNLEAVLARVRRLATPVGTVELDRVAPAPNPHRDLRALLVAVAQLAAADRQLVLVRIDEVQNARDPDQLSGLMVALADALAETRTITDATGRTHTASLPLAVYLTGLPEFLMLTEQAGASFGRRFQRFDLEPLGDDEVRFALAPFRTDGYEILTDAGPRPVFLDDDAVDALVAMCKGDPYLFQLAGEAAWNAGVSEHISVDDVSRGWASVSRLARTHVERIVDQLPPRERDTLEAIADLDPEVRTATATAQALGVARASGIASALQRLDTTRAVIRRGSPITFRMRTIEALLTSTWPEQP